MRRTRLFHAIVVFGGSITAAGLAVAAPGCARDGIGPPDGGDLLFWAHVDIAIQPPPDLSMPDFNSDFWAHVDLAPPLDLSDAGSDGTDDATPDAQENG